VTVLQERTAAPAPASMRPARYRVAARVAETYDTVTLMLRPVDNPIEPPRPGQFTMLYSCGVGEVPVSVSGFRPGGSRGQVLVQTIRAVGAVTRACAPRPPATRSECAGRSAPTGGCTPPMAVTWWPWLAGSAWRRCARRC